MAKEKTSTPDIVQIYKERRDEVETDRKTRFEATHHLEEELKKLRASIGSDSFKLTNFPGASVRIKAGETLITAYLKETKLWRVEMEGPTCPLTQSGGHLHREPVILQHDLDFPSLITYLARLIAERA